MGESWPLLFGPILASNVRSLQVTLRTSLHWRRQLHIDREDWNLILPSIELLNGAG